MTLKITNITENLISQKVTDLKHNNIQKTAEKSFSEVLKKNGIPESLQEFLKSVEREGTVLDQTIKDAIKGKEFSLQELIAIQVGVYRYNQDIDLISKLIEKTTSGIKQIINNGK